MASLSLSLAFIRKHPAVSLGGVLILAGYMLVCLEAGNDFRTFYELGRVALEGDSRLYDAVPGTGMVVRYLPFFALLMMVWALLPFGLSAGLWFWLKCWLIALMAGAFSRWSSRYSERERWIHVTLPLILCFNFLNNDFRLGQVNIIVHVLAVAAFAVLGQGRPVLSSFLFALSAFKITPLTLLPYFVLRRQWQFLAGVVVWLTVFAVALVSWFGWAAITVWPSQWLEASYTSRLSATGLAYFQNQSVPGMATRFGIDNSIAYGVSAVVLGGACLWALRRRVTDLEVGEFCVFLVTMLLISPDTRTAHMVHLLLPTYFLVSSVQWSRFNWVDHWWALAAGVVFLGTSRDLVGDRLFDLSLYTSSHTIVMLVFLLLLMKQDAGLHDKTPVVLKD